jgi:hypothetical protein
MDTNYDVLSAGYQLFKMGGGVGEREREREDKK